VDPRRAPRPIWISSRPEPQEPLQAPGPGTLSSPHFCRGPPAGARPPVSLRREDLLRNRLTPSLEQDLRGLNRPVGAALAKLARRLYGSTSRTAIQRTELGVIDLPEGALRRYLLAGERLPPALRGQIEAAALAVLT